MLVAVGEHPKSEVDADDASSASPLAATVVTSGPAGVAEAVTMQERPSTGGRLTAPGQRSQPREAAAIAALSLSPEETMRQAEMDQLRKAGLLFLPVLIAAIAAVFFFVDGHPVVEPIYLGALGSWFLAYQLLMHLTRPENREGYTEDQLILPWTLVAFIVAINQVYWGAFSAGIIVSSVSLTVISPGFSLKTAVVYYVIVAAAQLFASIAIMLGYPDVGVVPADHLPLRTLMLLTGLLQGLLLLAFLFGRARRKATLARIAELQDAVRIISQRDAVLAEAREDFERALGLQGEGAFTNQILGSYRLGVVIGRGAMGEVYEASHQTTGQIAAVKVLRRSALADPDLAQRFLREVQLASMIKDPHVVQVFEVGARDAPIPYIAMEKLSGETLAEYLRRDVRLSVHKAVELVQQLAEGVGAAHAQGIVHRDLKPQNVFLARGAGGPRWKVLDFGVSKLLGEGGELTADRVVGTPQYMAPEQAQGETVDARADVYGVTALLYRALTGHPPFPRGDLHAVLHNVVYLTPVQPSHLAKVPKDVEDVLMIGMAKEPAERFQTVAELAQAFARAARGELGDALQARAARLASEQPWTQAADPV